MAQVSPLLKFGAKVRNNRGLLVLPLSGIKNDRDRQVGTDEPELATLCSDIAKTYVGERKLRTIPTKDLPHQVVFLGGVVCELSEPKKKAKY